MTSCSLWVHVVSREHAAWAPDCTPGGNWSQGSGVKQFIPGSPIITVSGTYHMPGVTVSASRAILCLAF